MYNITLYIRSPSKSINRHWRTSIIYRNQWFSHIFQAVCPQEWQHGQCWRLRVGRLRVVSRRRSQQLPAFLIGKGVVRPSMCFLVSKWFSMLHNYLLSHDQHIFTHLIRTWKYPKPLFDCGRYAMLRCVCWPHWWIISGHTQLKARAIAYRLSFSKESETVVPWTSVFSDINLL